MSRKELTEFERGEIIGLWKGKHSLRDIEKILNHPKSTVHNIIDNYKKQNLTTAMSRSGRPKLLTERNTRQLTKIVKNNRNNTLDEITEELNSSLNLSVSKRTVQRTLHQEGYHGRVAKKKPFISEKNRKKRLGWCRMRINWTNEWEKIIWSDESRFELFQNDSKSWVWRKVNEKYNVECLKPTVKNSVGIMVWGCFYKNQVGPIVLVEGTLNADKYIKLLKENLLPFLNELGIGEYIFQDDNAPCHAANSTKIWKANNSINSLSWPAKSPDLNPIENLWDELERKVRKHLPLPKNKQELMIIIQNEWYNISQNTLLNLVKSMPRRIKAVIKSKGNPTKY